MNIKRFIFFVFLVSTTNTTKRITLKRATDELSKLARVTNGFTVQSELTKDPKLFSAITSELLGIGSTSLLDTLLGFNSSVSNDLNTLFAGIQNAKISKVDTVQVGSKINTLNGMTKDVAELKKGTDVKTVEEFRNNMGAAKLTIEFDKLQRKFYLKVADALHTIMTITPIADAGSITKQAEALQLLKTQIPKFCKYFKELGDKTSNSFKHLWPLRDGHLSLKPLLTVTAVAKEFSSKIQNPSSMSSDLGNMKTDVDNLNVLLESSQKSTIGESLTAFVKSISSNKRAEKALTLGFVNGISDIEQIFKDLKGEWLKNNIGNGKDLDKVANSLKTLNALLPNLKVLGDSWNKLWTKESSRKAAEFVAGLLIKTEASSKNVKPASALRTSFGSMQGILKNLKLIAKLPDLDAFEALVARYEQMNQRITALESVFDEIAASKVFKNLDNLNQIKTIVGDETTALAVALNETNLIRGIPEVKELSEFITKVTNQLKDGGLAETETFIDQEQNWALVDEVQKSLDGTDLLAVLENIQNSKFDAAGTASFVSFASDVRAIKSAQTEIDATMTFLTDLTAVVTAGNAAESSTKLAKSRERRETLTPQLNMITVNQLGTAVQVLQNMDMVSEKKTKVIGLADAKASVTAAVVAVAQDVWTDGNRAAMKSTVVEVEKLEKFVQGLANDDWDTLVKVFDEAAKVKGAPIDTKKFADPIGVALEKSTDPDVKAAAVEFRDLSTLELDFAAKERDLKTASLTLNPIRAFFDQVLGISKVDQVTQVVTEEPTDYTLIIVIIVIVVVLLLIVVIIAVLCYRKRAKAKKEEDEESKKKTSQKEDEKKENKKEDV